MAIPPRNAEKTTGSTYDTFHARIHSMVPLSARLTLAPTPTSWGLAVQDTQRTQYPTRQGIWMENGTFCDEYGQSRRDNSGGHELDMRTFVKDHMSKEDLRKGSSKQDWIDLQNLGRELTRWEESINCMNYTPQERKDGPKSLRESQNKSIHGHRHGADRGRIKKSPASMEAPE